jgi:polar amino acid transport system substrate-binding protein
MKKILKIFFWLTLFTMLSSGNNLRMSFSSVQAATEKKEIKIAFFNVPPHIYMDEQTGQMKGAVYDLLENYIAPEINVKFIWDANPSAIPRQVKMLEKEKEYASALLIYTPERAQEFIFPQDAYGSGQTALCLLKSDKLDKVTKVEDIAALTIGYGENATISPFMKSDKIKFELVSTSNFNEVNFKKLQVKRIDAVYTPDKASLLFFMKQMNLEKEFKIVDLPEKPSTYNIVFTQSLKDVAERYNQAFKKLNGKKLYLKLLSKYVDTSRL